MNFLEPVMDFLTRLPGHVADAAFATADLVVANPMIALLPLFTAGTIGLTLYRAYRIRRVQR